VTKAEFLDQLAADERLGSKKTATDALDAVLEAITGALSNGEEVSFTGFGKFHVAERGPRQGVNPRTGERVTQRISRP
jgi:DNA-binding protein HU-beta